MEEERQLPTIESLYQNRDLAIQQNKLAVLLNQPPNETWISEHPFVSVKDSEGRNGKLKYLPIERIEWLMTNVFKTWHVEIRNTQLIGNSVVVTVRVHYTSLMGDEKWTDGIGATPLQTDKGSGATDFNKLKASAVQMAAPSAETYAIKDACEKLGKLFGKDLNRQRDIAYDSLLKQEERFNSLERVMEPNAE